MVRLQDVVVLSIASFLGNVGVALTGFGMAIIYLFIYQIVVLAGYDGDFRFAVFIQALALFSAQPLLLKNSEFKKYASWKVLRYFIPVTIISTPLGQITGDVISTDIIKMVAGCLVTFVATFEMYQKRELFAKHIRKIVCRQKKVNDTNAEKTSDEENQNVSSSVVVTFLDTEESAGEETGAGTLHFNDIYKLGKTLGKGAFSIVKEGWEKNYDSQSFAIKIVNKASLVQEEKARLDEEISILQEIRHENILFLHQVYDEPQAYYLVSDMMGGGDLLTRLAVVGFFADDEACRVAKAILDAVRYIHDHKIVHRDIKPENILLGSDENNAKVKLADFGFAKRETVADSFSTLCGTPAYAAPEILNGEKYGSKVDLWSFGIIIWVMLVGYQPFRGETEQEVRRAIKSGKFVFDEEYWEDVHDDTKNFISSLLVLDPAKRFSAKDAQSHRWILDGENREDTRVHATKVYFMIGSQRSGSNWLRTMLGEREDLAGPHPPHIMRDFLPIIDKFGDLSNDKNFRVLVDHVCTLVERNQVPWTDKHGFNIFFLRPIIYAHARKSCMRIQRERGEEGDLCKGMYLLSIFDAIMFYHMKVNGKQTWICKSMGMSQHHDLLLEFYGKERLRYIYLVRDPRDVAMSFMKTPVGDCHWHAIATKWTKLQHFALSILKDFPELIYKLHYENILLDKENEVKLLFDFIGERRFGGVKRQASVLCMETTENVINRAKDGSEAQKAKYLSYQFQNLGRGMSFAATQHQKWLHPETGLKKEEIQIIESVAHEVMFTLGYFPQLVGDTTEPTVWSNSDLDHFEKLNQDGIKKMNKDLAKENPDDLRRRLSQALALNMPPIYQPAMWEGADTTDSRMWEQIRDYLSDSQSSGPEGVTELDEYIEDYLQGRLRTFLSSDKIASRRDVSGEDSFFTKSGIRIRWASATQSGYYADHQDKPNQDRKTCRIGMTKEDINWFGVYDGNGPNGHDCSEFARKEIAKEFGRRIASGLPVLPSLKGAYNNVHERLIETKSIETDISGTTSTTLLLMDNECLVANVGDSPAILGWQDVSSDSLSARLLYSEHTPKRTDERMRIKRSGGVVMTVDQRDGAEPIHENWREDEIPRVWSTDESKLPGCAFTRSIGNGIAHTLGVTAYPEFSKHHITKNDRVLIVASDGVTEFMDPQTCVQIACSCSNPSEAANALVEEASERWLTRGDYMDDITVIVLFIGSANRRDVLRQNSILSRNINLEIALAVADTEEEKSSGPLGMAARLWTLVAGSGSGFLGGLCGIRGPPVILYFLHPPKPIKFNKKEQRATGALITATNVAMRVTYYFVETFALQKDSFFKSSDWYLYVCVILCSVGGVLVGSHLFDKMKDSRNNIRMILSIFLLLCGVSLLLSAFHFRV